MDLTAAISNLQQAKTLGSVQLAVAKKVLEAQQRQGSAAVKLIQAATSSVSEAGDALTAASIGLGGSLDTYG